MTLTQLRYFVAAARCRSLNKAAEQLRVAQPAITRQLKLLEDELESVLLARSHRGVELTQAGRLLLERAEFQIETFDRIRSDLRERSFAPSGRLRIGCTPALSAGLLARPIASFSQRHPQVVLEHRELLSDQLVDCVCSDGLDFAIVSGAHLSPHLSRQTLFHEPIWLFARSEADLSRTAQTCSLAGLRLILSRRHNAVREAIEHHASEQGVKLDVVAESDSTRLMGELACFGAGVVAAPYLSFADKLGASLAGVPLCGLSVERSLIKRKDRPASRAAREMIELLKPEVHAITRRLAGAAAVQNFSVVDTWAADALG